MLLILVAFFCAIVSRLVFLQFAKAEHYRILSELQQYKFVSEKPQRGVILDCRARVLAASRKKYNIFAEPRVINDPKKVSNALRSIINTPPHLICSLITESKNPGYAKLKADATESQCLQAQRIHYGIGVESDWKRTYPASRLTSHLIGFTSADNRGLEGIELRYDQQLRGQPGRNIFFKDKNRRSIKFVEQTESLEDGVGIILTIDAAIQQFVHSELSKQLAAFEAESAVAIVAEPKTGAILAMVSLPDFDPNNIRFADIANFRNRAITDQFEPGSIFKPFAAAIALDTGVVNRTEKIFCENGSYSGRGFGQIGEYGNHAYGSLTVRDILVKSSNIGMAKLGQKLGKEKLYTGLTLFGFGKKTDIDLPGEVTGLLRTTDKWTGYSTTRIPFGQEITVTALQVVRAFSMLANGGRFISPYLVHAIVDNNGKIIEVKKTDPPIGFVIDPQVAKWIVTNALVGVVNEKDRGGTGWRAKLEKWQVFGKTGTANIAKEDEKGYSDQYVASFIGGAPAEDPKIVVLVSIRKPNKKLGKGYTGGTVAAPIVGRIIEKTLTYLQKGSV